MARFLFLLGLALMALPFVVMLFEVVYAELTGATGDHKAMAGFWGVWIGFITFIPALLLALFGGFLSLSDR